MYLYFDKSGLLKEVINDEALRVGNDGANTVFAYFEGDRIINGVYFNILRNGDTSPIRHAYTSLVSKQIPYDANRTLNYFKYFVNYNFYTYTFDSTDLAINGLLKLTIQAYDNSDIVFALGLVPLIVEASAVAVTSAITTSEYEDLLRSVANCPTWSALETYIGLSRADLQGLSLANVKAYIDSYHINKVENTMITGVLITTITLNNGLVLSDTVDLKNTFYAKSLVYSKEEADNKFLASGELNDFLTIASASETYETKVDSASKLTEAKSYTDTNVATLNEKNTTQDTAITNAQDKADSAYTLASGKTTGYTFDTYLAMKTALASATSSVYKVGDSLFIKETNMPDYWVSKVNSVSSGDYGFYEVDILESDMQEYQKITDNTLTTTSKTIPGSINELNNLKAPASTTQTITDNTLTTTSKTVSGAINENKASIDTLSETVDTNIGRIQRIDLTGSLSGGVITFTTSDTYTLKENCTYELDLHFNVAGNIDLDNTMLITINDTTINLQNILNNSGTMKVRDMLQSEKYTNAVGYRWIFNAVYNTVNSNAFFGIPATINKQDIISLSTSEISAKLQGFEKGQIVQDNTTGLFYIVSLDFATETRSLVEMSSAFAKSSAISAVGFSGEYSDLLNKPTIPTKTSQLTNDSSYVNNTNYASSTVGGVVKVKSKATTDTEEVAIDSTGKLYSKKVPTANSELTNDSNYVSTTSYANNTTGGVVKATPISDISSVVEVKIYNGKLYCPSVPTLDVQVVSALPTTGNSGVIYLVPKTGATQDIYSEFIWVNSAWEELGGFEIDLSGYLTIASAQSTYQPLINASNLLSASFVSGLKSVATTGSYVDLLNTPDLTIYLTKTSATNTYQPIINAINKLSVSYITGLATVATSGSYTDLTDKPTILENFLINGSVDTNGDITFVSLVVADLITAIQSNEVITFVPSNTDLHSIILTTSKEDSGNSIYMLSGSYTTNGTSKITNYDCKISITSGVATGSYSIKEQVDSGGSGFKQTFNVDGSEWGNCYKGLNEMLKEDDMGRPADTYVGQTLKIFKSWQLNNVDVAYPKQITGANSYSATFDNVSSADDIANLSWDTIIAFAKNKAFDSTHLGQTKQLDIGGVAYTVQIVGVNHDDLTDGTGKANLTFQLKYLLATNYGMNATATNSGGWEASKMRTNVLPNILSQMPTNIQNAIKSVNKANCKVYNSATITYTSDKLFLLSEAEVFGVKSYAAALEGTQYEYWANNNTASARIKCQGEGGTTAYYWWLRSPYSSSSGGFCIVSPSGGIYYSSASDTRGVSLAFDL